MLNAQFPYTKIIEENTRFTSPDCGKNICLDGFFLTEGHLREIMLVFWVLGCWLEERGQDTAPSTPVAEAPVDLVARPVYPVSQHQSRPTSPLLLSPLFWHQDQGSVLF